MDGHTYTPRDSDETAPTLSSTGQEQRNSRTAHLYAPKRPSQPGVEQHTLASSIRCTGIGVHSGAPATLEIRPAEEDSGLTLIRSDKPPATAQIPALWHYVTDTRMCTALTNEYGTSLSTVEHVMAALAGCGIDNADILVDGPEVPIMDGSSAEFINMIEEAGREALSGSPRRFIRILKEVTVRDGDKWATLSPDETTSYEMTIDFSNPAIGRQTRTFIPTDETSFSNTLARARTFGFLHEVEQLQKMGLGKGGSLDNAVVIDKERILNTEGLRYEDEFVRHKLLDSVGDLSLAGAPFIGAYRSYKGGHALNNQLLHELFSSSRNWEWTG